VIYEILECWGTCVKSKNSSWLKKIKLNYHFVNVCFFNFNCHVYTIDLLYMYWDWLFCVFFQNLNWLIMYILIEPSYMYVELSLCWRMFFLMLNDMYFLLITFIQIDCSVFCFKKIINMYYINWTSIYKYWNCLFWYFLSTLTITIILNQS